MAKSMLFGRRIHIAGSISQDPDIANSNDVCTARNLVSNLVKELIRVGATFVVPVDAEKKRDDGHPICFDWLIWQAIKDNIAERPADSTFPLAIAVQHHKSEDQIPPQMLDLWDGLRATDLVGIENASHWNMNSKRMELQAKWGDILIAIGGGEGVTFLANLYHAAGKHIVPLDAALTPPGQGARKLFDIGLAADNTAKLFTTKSKRPHQWINQIKFSDRIPVEMRTKTLIKVLEDLEPPRAFAVRLLDCDHPEFEAVDEFFELIVRPIVEVELGYQLTVVDGQQPFDHARIDQEIFSKLHRSSLVVADITGARPNCFLELGYSLGRNLPTMVTWRKGSDLPFDIATLGGLTWETTGRLEERKRAFLDHHRAIRNRPPLVPIEQLVS